MWKIPKTLLAVYTAISTMVLVMFMFARCPEAGGGELAMWMYFISAPAGFATGILLSYINYMHPPSVFSSLPGRGHLFMVWFPFFFGGLLQWGMPYVISRLLTKNDSTYRQNGHKKDADKS